MEEKSFNLFGGNQTLISHCPICNLRYDPLLAQVLQEGERANLVHIKCRHCHATILALIVANNFGISSIGLITDLSADDVIRFKSAKVINCDEVIEAHQFFKSQEKVLIDYFD